MHSYLIGLSKLTAYLFAPCHPARFSIGFVLLMLFSVVHPTNGAEAERFFISIPGPVLSYVPLYYGAEKGFFSQEGLDLQVLVVRGIIGVSSLMSGEIDVTCHAGSGFSAALRGIPVKIIFGHPRSSDPRTHCRSVDHLIYGPQRKSHSRRLFGRHRCGHDPPCD